MSPHERKLRREARILSKVLVKMARQEESKGKTFRVEETLEAQWLKDIKSQLRQFT